jgi:hypothetical protein
VSTRTTEGDRSTSIAEEAKENCLREIRPLRERGLPRNIVRIPIFPNPRKDPYIVA